MSELAGNAEVLAAYERLQTKILRVRYRIDHDPTRVETSRAEHDGIMAAFSVRAGLDVAARLIANDDATARVVLEAFSALKRPTPTIG